MKTPSSRQTSCFLLLALLSVALAVVAAANLDKELKLDGSTTYCHGVQNAHDPLAMDAIRASSADRCPLFVKLSPSSLVIKPREPLTVDWRTTINVAAMTSGLFPNAIDAKSKLPRDVGTSILRACKAGSNCVGASNVVVPAATGPSDAERGPFDDQGRKALRAHRFTFESEGEYVVVGEVLLPGDPSLNISATAFVAFQRVTVTIDGAASMVMATVRPSSSAGSSDGMLTSDADGRTNLRFQSPSEDITAPPSSGGIDAEFRGKPQPKNSSASDHLLTIIGAIGGVVVIAVIVFLLVSRQRRKAADEAAAAARKLAPRKPSQGPQAEIYRLDFSLDDVPPKSQQRHHLQNNKNKTTLAPVTQFPRFSLNDAVPVIASFPSQRPISKKQGSWETTISVLDDDLHSVRRSSVSTSQFNDSQYGGLERLTSIGDLHDSSPSSGRTSAASSFISESRDSSRLFLTEISAAPSIVLAPKKPIVASMAPNASYLRDTSEFHVRFSDRESEDHDDIDGDVDEYDCSSSLSSSPSSIYSY